MIDFTKAMEMSIPSPAGPRKVVFRFPSDDDLARRQRARQMIIKGHSEDVVETPSLDLSLFQACRIEGPDLDPSEATFWLQKLSSINVTDCGREEGGFFVDIEWAGAKFRHVVRTPSAAELFTYRKKALTSAPNRYGYTMTVHLEPGRALYDKLAISADGYPGGYVPITHKAQVVSEVSGFIDREVLIENPLVATQTNGQPEK